MKEILSFKTIFLVFLIPVFFSCSEKISIEESVKSEGNVLAWTANDKALTSQDIQQDNILNVLYVGHTVYGLIKQLDKDANPNIEIDWFSAEKNLIAQTQDHWDYDERFPEYFVARDGKSIVAIDQGNRVRVFDSSGKELRRFKLLKDYKYSEESVVYGTVSEDFKLLFTGTKTAIGARVTLRTLKNKIIFSKLYEDWKIRVVAISPDNNNFGVAIYKQGDPIQFKTFVLDNEGKVVYESAVRTRRILFDRQSSYVAFLDKNSLELADLKSSKMVGSFKLLNEKHIIIAEAFSHNGVLMLQSAETVLNKKDSFNPWQYVDNTLISLNMHASEIARINFNDDWVIKPMLKFDAGTKQFFYGHNAGYKIINAVN